MTNNMSKLDANQPTIHNALTSTMNKNTRYSNPPSMANITGNKRECPNDLEEEDEGEVREMEGQGLPAPQASHSVSNKGDSSNSGRSHGNRGLGGGQGSYFFRG